MSVIYDNMISNYLTKGGYCMTDNERIIENVNATMSMNMMFIIVILIP